MTTPFTRRSVLGALGGGAAATVLTGCGDDGDATSGSASGSPSEPASESPSGSASESASGSASGSASSAGGDLVATADVPVGSGVILKDAEVVVTQPEEGTFKAFSAICTHQGCPVGTVSGDQIMCPCHGSVFSVTDGSVIGGPAPKPLPAVEISVQGGQVVQA